jgi:uncharacterized SAM-binding protein YcdF (DUF218 family)
VDTVSNPASLPESKPVRNIRPIIAIAIVLALLGAGTALFLGAGRWLIRENALEPADVIVVLSGGLPYRALEAAAIYNHSCAPEIWVSRPESPAQNMEALGVQYVGEEEYNSQILIQQGVPPASIHIFPEAIVDTQQEVEEIAREMHREGKSRVIIVTSPQHTRRVRALWNRIVGNDPKTNDPKMIVRAAFEDPFDAAHWWRNTRDALSVVREYLGLLNVWAGAPIHPHTR